jgi:hypothetical protein
MSRAGNRPANSLLRLAALAIVAAIAACHAPPPAETGTNTLESLDGPPVDPFAGRAGSLVLLVFLVDGCPIANALSPEIARIGDEVRARGAAAWLVYPDPHAEAAAIERRHREYAIELPTLFDPTHALVRATGATISPEAALVRLDGSGGFDLLYRGRINDLFAAPGRRRPSARTHELRSALDAAFSGRRPDPDRTTAVGCILEPPA